MITILLIQPDPETRTTIERLLKTQGYQLVMAKDGKTGIEMANCHQPDLIVSDIEVNGPEGGELKDLLSKESDLRSVPLLLLVNKPLSANKSQLSNDNIDYVIKPIDPRFFLNRVKFLLKRSKIELDEASKVFSNEGDQSFLPSNSPQISGYDIHFSALAASTGGGDILDYIKIKNFNFAFLFGDVTGKGAKAKFFAYSFLGYLRGLVYPMIISDEYVSPSQLIGKLSQLVDIDPFLQDIFITLFMVHFDFSQHHFTYTNAGYMPALYFDAYHEKIKELNVGGGIPAFSFSEYEQESLDCMPNDILVICSDGVTEAKNRDNVILGLNAVKTCILENSQKCSKEIASNILAMVQEYTGEQQSQDDMSVSIIKRNNAD